MLHEQVGHGVAIEWTHTREQLLINASEAVLIAKTGNDAVESFRGRINRRNATRDQGPDPLQVLHLAEVGNFDVVVKQKQILWLDVQMLELKPVVHQVEDLGGLGHVLQQFIPGDTREAFLPALQGPPFPQLQGDALAHEAFTLFSSGQSAVAVMRDEQLEGIVTKADLLDFWAHSRSS